ncbi:MAG: hypothetical protein SOX74_04820 [Candidatus Faecousia sp.]|uniref:hypothetical protein n=1 Tax=Faecousia sp. TaxID=2952921 RepID=UPI002A8E0D37|nr:hypothetical protein [Candidatus Faecousia sp.]
MAEYIEREALQAALQRKKAGAANGRYTDGWNDCLMRCKSMVSCFPAADVAPVMRCKDCKHSWEDISGQCCSYGPLVDCVVPDDFFCALAERKDVNEK